MEKCGESDLQFLFDEVAATRAIYTWTGNTTLLFRRVRQIDRQNNRDTAVFIDTLHRQSEQKVGRCSCRLKI